MCLQTHICVHPHAQHQSITELPTTPIPAPQKDTLAQGHLLRLFTPHARQPPTTVLETIPLLRNFEQLRGWHCDSLPCTFGRVLLSLRQNKACKAKQKCACYLIILLSRPLSKPTQCTNSPGQLFLISQPSSTHYPPIIRPRACKINQNTSIIRSSPPVPAYPMC